MGRCVAKIGEDKYLMWSTVVDAPTTYIMSRQEMIDYMITNAVTQATDDAEQSLKRADENGTSWQAGSRQTFDDLIVANRAGKNEERLTKEELIEEYTYREEK